MLNSICATNTLVVILPLAEPWWLSLPQGKSTQNGLWAVWAAEDQFHSSDIKLHLNFQKPNFLLDQYSQYKR